MFNLLNAVFMLEKSFGLLFYLKKPSYYRGGNMPIYMRITVDGLPKEVSTKRTCDPERWNSEAQRAKRSVRCSGTGTSKQHRVTLKGWTEK